MQNNSYRPSAEARSRLRAMRLGGPAPIHRRATWLLLAISVLIVGTLAYLSQVTEWTR